MNEQIITDKKMTLKDNRPNLLSEHDVFPAALYTKSVVIKGWLWWSDVKTTEYCFLTFLLTVLAVFWGNKEKWVL